MKEKNIKFKIILITILFFGFLGFVGSSQAANIYVDKTVASNCTSGNYSIASRNCTGSAGNAYHTIQESVNAMLAGDHIILRGGTYTECVDIPTSKNGAAWTEGNYNKISSCNMADGCPTNEWAILDGNNACTSVGAVIGHVVSEVNGSADIKYWWLERLEIKNGRRGDGTTGYGFNGNGGPFKIRYCYIHDNKGAPGTSQCDDLPAGTWGQQWHDSTIEYNWYADNGGTAENNNCKQLGWVPSYDLTNDVEANGLTITGSYIGNGSYPVEVNNEIKYNYVTGGRIGIAPKHFTFLTGRNPGGGHDYSDAYSDKGMKIHHNILYNMSGYAIGAHEDFAQVYNNIIDMAQEGIRTQYDYVNYPFMYKVAAYNNTMMNLSTNRGYYGLGQRYASWISQYIHSYTYNNICDGCGDGADWCGEDAFTPKMRCSGELALDYSNVFMSNNYFYRPDNDQLYQVDSTTYGNTTFEAQAVTHTPKNSYSAAYNAGNLLYRGTSGADKYIIRSGHTIEATTAGTGGIGGAHPYIAGVTIPSYIGAANPNDNDWVSGVLNLTSVSNMQNAGNGDPNWIEGGGSPDVTPPNAPTGLSVQ